MKLGKKRRRDEERRDEERTDEERTDEEIGGGKKRISEDERYVVMCHHPSDIGGI